MLEMSKGKNEILESIEQELLSLINDKRNKGEHCITFFNHYLGDEKYYDMTNSNIKALRQNGFKVVYLKRNFLHDGNLDWDYEVGIYW